MPDVLDVDALVAPTPTDPEPPNGSSIAFIAEWQGKRVLMGGDAHPGLLAASLAPLAESAGGRLPIDLLKLPHHGSRGNVTREVIDLLDCDDFLISTDGKRHGHPDPQAIARLLKFSPARTCTLRFNYRTSRTEPWDDAKLKAQHDYTTEYGDPAGFLTINI
jgi:beta-lactamase superfamily II metal-dependent hydrolase